MYPTEPDLPMSSAGKGTSSKGSSTPKGVKPKDRESLPDSSRESRSQSSDLTPVVKDVDPFVSVKKHITPVLIGFSPKKQVEIDTAILQQTALKGISVNMSDLLCRVLHLHVSLHL